MPAKRKRRSKYDKPAFEKLGKAPPVTDPYKVTSLSADDEERFQRAQRAVRNFRKMLPSLNGYVKAVTKNPRTRIELYAGPPATDGDTIFMQPPIAFGDEYQHDAKWCWERDEHGILICEACRNNEGTGLSVRHECAHIIFDSFAEMTENDKIELLDLALKEWSAKDGDSRAAKLKKKLEAYKKDCRRRGKPFNYVAANNVVSPFLPFIFNGLEDARVNIAMYNARPGTYKMFKAHSAEIFTRGVEQMDGTWMGWREQPLDAQAVVALYSKSIGFPYEGFFADEVVEALKDPVFDKLCKKVREARSPRAIYKLGFPMLEALRKHGFCKLEGEPEDPEEGGPGEAGEEGEAGDEGESGEGGDGESGEYGDAGDGKMAGKSGESDETDDSDEEGEDGHSRAFSRESDTDDGPGSSGEGDDDDEDLDEDGDGMSADTRDAMERATKAISGHEDFGGGWGSGDDGETPAEPTDDQVEVSRAVNQERYFDQPSRSIFSVKEWENLDPSAPGWENEARSHGRYTRFYGDSEIAPESVMAPALAKMRIVFSDNRKKRKHENLKKGRISTKHLRRVLTDDPRIFQKRTEPGERDYFVVIGLDISGSTASGAIKLMKSAGMAQAELLSRAGMKFAVYAHTGTYHSTRGGGSSLGGLFADIHVVKAPHESWGDRQRERLNKLVPASANLDGHTLEYYRKVAEAQKATDKLIMYYTDGAMPAENYNEELEVLQREIRDMPRRGMTCVGVGIQTDAPVQHGLDTIQIDELSDIPLVVDELKKRLTATADEKRRG